METPVGFNGIIQTFGDIREHIDATQVLLPSWNQEYLAIAQLPYPMTVAWDTTVTVNRMTCHKLMVPIFEQTFTAILNAGLQSTVQYFGGCFMYRPQRTGKNKLSTHAWGIAIDLDPLTNEQGQAPTIDPKVVAIFKANGFEWGGDWHPAVRDGMHFQFATSY